MKALLLLNVEPELDAANPPAARAALQRSGLVVALTSFKDAAVENADVLLPIAPFTETAGSFVNAEGRLQSFTGVVAPLGDTRPAWKVLRVLGNLLGLPGFEPGQCRAGACRGAGRCRPAWPHGSTTAARRCRPRSTPSDRHWSALPMCPSMRPTPWCGGPNRCS